MKTHDNTETVTSYMKDGTTYEIDHLGICSPNQAGSYAVYRDGKHIAEFLADPYPEDADVVFDANLVAASVQAVRDAGHDDN